MLVREDRNVVANLHGVGVHELAEAFQRETLGDRDWHVAFGDRVPNNRSVTAENGCSPRPPFANRGLGAVPASLTTGSASDYCPTKWFRRAYPTAVPDEGPDAHRCRRRGPLSVLADASGISEGAGNDEGANPMGWPLLMCRMRDSNPHALSDKAF